MGGARAGGGAVRLSRLRVRTRKVGSQEPAAAGAVKEPGTRQPTVPSVPRPHTQLQLRSQRVAPPGGCQWREATCLSLGDGTAFVSG